MVLISEHKKFSPSGKLVYFDNDILFLFFTYIELNDGVFAYCKQGEAIIDPLTRFEFLRDLYDPRQLKIKEQFLASFLIATTQAEQVKFIQGNALTISRIYAIRKKEHIAKPSYVDLMLAARIMGFAKSSILVTGNRKDFPSCLFDIEALISFEEQNGIIRNVYVLTFNELKFSLLYQEMEDQKESLTKKF